MRIKVIKNCGQNSKKNGRKSKKMAEKKLRIKKRYKYWKSGMDKESINHDDQMNLIRYLFSYKSSKKNEEFRSAVENCNIDLVSQILSSANIDVNSKSIFTVNI